MKKIIAYLLVVSMLILTFGGCGADSGNSEADGTGVSQSQDKNGELTVPKYVFLFIGDGMSYPQIQATADYLGAAEDENYFEVQPSIGEYEGGIALAGPEYLNFMNFEAVGSAVNYDSNSFAPDSSSSATSIATGHKTYSGTLNMDETFTAEYETIAEKLHSQLGMKIGIVTSVTLNHATPAAFYAHQPSRGNYYEIGLELADSGFEYFAGGGLYAAGEPDSDDYLYTVAENAGYKIAYTNAEAEAVTSDDEKVIITSEYLADSRSLEYEIDRSKDAWSLADYVSKGIEVLDNDKGFFMMCEGGKIDWACHANDAATVIGETLALSNAVQVAVDFAEKHPGEALIIVTGDHETGGLSIGFAGTDYDTYLTLLESQKISFRKFDDEYVSGYKKDKPPVSDVLNDIEELFGLTFSFTGEDNKLALTMYEMDLISKAYSRTLADITAGPDNQEEYVMYGDYEPLTVTVTHILNNKAGLNFSSYSHSGLPVAVFADGVNADMFDGYYDNTEIFGKLAAMFNVK